MPLGNTLSDGGSSINHGSRCIKPSRIAQLFRQDILGKFQSHSLNDKVYWQGYLQTEFSMSQSDSPHPAKPINIIVPLGAGSTVDIIARVFGAEMSKSLGQPVTVELLPGAGGTTGTAKAARSAPDGYTITIASNGTHAINMGLYANPGYDPIRDFAPVALVGSVTNVMIVNPANPARTPQDVAEAARAKPGELTYSSGGVGTTHHFSGVMFASMAKLDLKHVPFKASLDGINQVVEGKITMGFFNLPTVFTQIKEGKLKALAVTGKTRSSYLPQLPTLDETGSSGSDGGAWFDFGSGRPHV